MLKNKVVSLLILFIFFLEISLFNVSYAIEAISVPETDINLKFENLTRGCKVYVLIPCELLNYNMSEFIKNNKDNSYEIEAKEAEKLQSFLDKEDYSGYVKYFKEVGFNQDVENEFELRHYCFAMGKEDNSIEDYEYNNSKYVKISINLDKNNQFKIIFKDYLSNYDISNVKFMIDEYGTITYIDVSNYPLGVNPEKNNIKEVNITYSYYESNEYDSIEKATRITYLVILIILILVVLFIIFKIIKHKKKKKQEIEDRKFWKKKLTKEEIKAQKRKKKQEKRMEKLNKRRNRS